MKTPLRICICWTTALLLVAINALVGIRWQHKLEHLYYRTAFQVIADHVTKGTPNPQTAVIRLLRYVHTRVVSPGNRSVGDVEPMIVLAAGRGWCDQQSNLLIQLARTKSLRGRLVFLRDASGSSPHSVAEIYMNGKWRVVDPLLGVPIFNREGEIATREDLAHDPEILQQVPHTPWVTYLASPALYEYPPLIFNTWRGKRIWWLDQLPESLRYKFICIIQELYLKLSPAIALLPEQKRLLQRARHYALLYRSEAAEKIYLDLIQTSNDPVVKQDACFFLGRLYMRTGQSEKALRLLNKASKENPIGYWAPFNHLTCGEAYQQLGKPYAAIEEYLRSNDLDDPGVYQQFKNLVKMTSGKIST